MIARTAIVIGCVMIGLPIGHLANTLITCGHDPVVVYGVVASVVTGAMVAIGGALYERS